jgi:hypothetical protein
VVVMDGALFTAKDGNLKPWSLLSADEREALAVSWYNKINAIANERNYLRALLLAQAGLDGLEIDNLTKWS